jgi:sucrose-6-phosphate hydrolase SacC (GH32 family)
MLHAAYAGDLFPPQFARFEPDPKNPIFTAQGEGHWDVKLRERGWILRDGETWHLWYTGYDGTREGLKMLGYATSKDGLAWTRVSIDAPLYREHWVEDMCVIKQGDTFYMFAEGFQDRAQLLTSPDGRQWTRQGLLDVRLANGEPIPSGPYGTPTVWFENDVWHLFYERRDLGIWLAKSTDLKIWTNVQDDPVIVPGPDDYDKDLIAMNQVFRHDGRYYAVLHGTKKTGDPQVPNKWTTNLAMSDDLVHWTKYEKNPLRPVAENKSSGLIFPDGDRFRLYTMHTQVDLFWSIKK